MSSILSVTQRGIPLTFWDDGDGPVYVYRESTGVVGVVRASTFEKAWNCVVDEILPDADVNDFSEEDRKLLEEGSTPECVHYRGSGNPSNEAPNRKTAIAQEDPVGSSLEFLTGELRNELAIEITWHADDQHDSED